MLTRTRHRIAVVTVASAIALTGLPVTAHATTAHATTAPAETSVATAGGGPCVTDFTDAPPTGSYYTAITWMACEGITAGYANGSFGKTRQITRGQTAQFLYRMSGDRHDAGSKRDFADVNPGGAGFTAISWMEAKGYSAGYTDGRFGINDPISRGELASFMYRMAGANKTQVPATSPYRDMKPTTPFYRSAAWLKSTGTVGGYADGTFRPGKSITRGETAAFLYALETHLNGKPAPPKTTPKPVSALPSADLQFGPYTGKPRKLRDIFHLECVHALDGEDVPEREDATLAPGEKPVWSVHKNQALTKGWKACPTQMYEQLAIPEAFTVQAHAVDGHGISSLRITDGSGQVVGGFRDDVRGGAPASVRLVKALEIAKLPGAPAADGEAPYLRTLLVETSTGPQLRIDQVSAAAGTNPATLKVWDLAAGAGQRNQVYASIPLRSVETAQATNESDLAAVLRSMVASYAPGVM